MAKHFHLTILLAVCFGSLLGACAGNTNDEDGSEENKTTPIASISTQDANGNGSSQPEPVSTLSLDEYQEECIRTDCFKGLDSILGSFTLDSYTCVYQGNRAVVWVVETEDPETYVTEGEKIEVAIGKIETYLNTSLSDYYKKEEKIHFFYGSTSIAFTPESSYPKPVIFMPSSRDPYSFHNYVHEMVHLLTPQHSDWVSEGLAVYLNDKWGGEGGYPNYGKDIDQSALSYLNRTDILENIGDETYYPSWADLRTSVGQGFYILSGSFVKYMIDSMGIETFMKVYSAPNMPDGLEKITKKSLQEWKTEWLGTLSNMKKE